jgi:hypothetical protein
MLPTRSILLVAAPPSALLVVPSGCSRNVVKAIGAGGVAGSGSASNSDGGSSGAGGTGGIGGQSSTSSSVGGAPDAGSSDGSDASYDAAHAGGSCDGGLTFCGGECVDTQNDMENCGACGNACSPLTYTACFCGRCFFDCPKGFGPCCPDLCAPLYTDPTAAAHAGTCARRPDVRPRDLHVKVSALVTSFLST